MQQGQVVSVNQLESTRPRFIAQLKGILTTQCYKYATIFVGWVVLLYQDEPEQTPMAKQQYDIKVAMAEPLIYATSSNPDIMYLHEAMKAPDRKNFL